MEFIIIILLSIASVNLANLAPEVTIEQGTVGGVVSADGAILEYIGIPYATANSTNRFQDALPAPTWEGVFNATTEYYCPQPSDGFGTIETEDCLRANVYIPTTANTTLPVMVWIHGGGFIHSSGGKTMFGPTFLVKNDIILVTINYRLGVLGFMCLGIKEAPGNTFLKDQIVALKWVKRNIAAFGGDPDNITIFGESGGAISVSLLLASEAADGLYNRAIVQSGSSISFWPIDRNPVRTASLLAKALGHDTEDPHELYEIFAAVPYEDLITADITIPNDGYFYMPGLVYTPCVENIIPGVESAITDLPYNLLSKKPKNIPVIFGTTSMEGLVFIVELNEESFERMNDEYLFGPDLKFPSEDKAVEVDRTIKQFYFGNESISINTRMMMSEVYNDLLFEIPKILESELYLAENVAPVYNYIFNYTGGRDFLRFRAGFENETGAAHGDDVFYLFDATLVQGIPITQEDQLMIDRFTKLWTNFAKYGDPTPPSDTVLPVRWTPSSEDDITFLYIDNEFRMGAMPNPGAYQLWSDIYAKYRNTETPTFNGAISLVQCKAFYIVLLFLLKQFQLFNLL